MQQTCSDYSLSSGNNNDDLSDPWSFLNKGDEDSITVGEKVEPLIAKEIEHGLEPLIAKEIVS